MGSIFGKSKAKSLRDSQITNQDKAVLQIKQQRDKIKQFKKRLVNQLENEKGLIKQLVQKNQKQKALLLLKKKKYTEKILEKTDNELLTIENLIMDIEFKNVEQNVLKGIQIGNEALKQLNRVFSIEQIESILDETEDGIKKQQEINDLLSGYKESTDEELDNELESILQKDIILPQVPETIPEDISKSKEKTSKDKPEKRILVEA